jgi:hypothetical protein
MCGRHHVRLAISSAVPDADHATAYEKHIRLSRLRGRVQGAENPEKERVEKRARHGSYFGQEDFECVQKNKAIARPRVTSVPDRTISTGCPATRAKSESDGGILASVMKVYSGLPRPTS